jgi:hypothetical protein
MLIEHNLENKVSLILIVAISQHIHWILHQSTHVYFHPPHIPTHFKNNSGVVELSLVVVRENWILLQGGQEL